jgi:hypothetical protein
MKKIVMLVAVILGTSFANANTVPAKVNASKEVKVNKIRKHKISKNTKIVKPDESKSGTLKTKK